MDDRLRIALLIDADNASPRTLPYVLDELAELGAANVRRAYGDWGSEGLRGWRKVLLDNAIQPHQQIAYTGGKNASDMAMVIDAMDLLYTRRVDAFALMSSDSDFTPLAMHLRAHGMQVYGFGKSNTPISFKAACTTFYHVDVVEPAAAGASGAQARATVDGEPAAPAPRRKLSTRELQADRELIELLRNAVDATADDDGWSNLGRIGHQLGFLTPKSYGYRSLKPLVLATELFDVRDDGAHVRPKRAGKPAPAAGKPSTPEPTPRRSPGAPQRG